MPRKNILEWIRRAQAGDNQKKHQGENQKKIDLSTTYKITPYLEICRKSHKIIKASPEFIKMAGRDIVGTHILDTCPHLPWLDVIEATFEKMIFNKTHIFSLTVDYDGCAWRYTLVNKAKSVVIVLDKCTADKEDLL